MNRSILPEKTHTFLISSHPCMNCVDQKQPLSEFGKLLFNHIKTEFEASAGMNVDRHLEFHVDATPIGKAAISLLVAYHQPAKIPAANSLAESSACEETVHCIPLRITNVITGLDLCVKYVLKQSIA